VGSKLSDRLLKNYEARRQSVRMPGRGETGAKLAQFGARALLLFLAAAAVIVGLPALVGWSIYCALGAPGWGKIE
jgi:hypothetical protein